MQKLRFLLKISIIIKVKVFLHAIQLNTDASVFDKLMRFIEVAPKEKVEVTTQRECLSISFEEVKKFQKG